MLVYGDPQFQERLSGLVGTLRQRLRRTDRDDLEALRSLLIVAGQLEQGLQDHWSGTAAPGVLQQSACATDLAAAAFHRAWHAASPQGPCEAPDAEHLL
ncbi:MAG TPA: hypothetical protein VNZ22_06850, partial [Bacillota bacterium]|nr:hypothetical protein [Bacillota bacterium]